jgi:hypothetical protein
MNYPNLFIATTAALLIAGCAAKSGTSTADADDDKSYVTGSRIPVKDPNATAAAAAAAKNPDKGVQDQMMKGTIYTGKPSN